MEVKTSRFETLETKAQGLIISFPEFNILMNSGYWLQFVQVIIQGWGARFQPLARLAVFHNLRINI